MKAELLRVGVLGGTFDPVHRGHLEMARTAARAVRLTRIYFVPAPRPWHRPAPVASYADRFAMLALALDGHRAWLPLSIPDRPRRPTYSIDQLQWMRAQGLGDGIHLIVGADAFAAISTWKDYRRLLRQCDFVVLARVGFGLDSVIGALPSDLVTSVDERGASLTDGRRVHWLPRLVSPANSTQARDRLRGASRDPGWVPAAVRRYARRAGLYQHDQNF